MIVVVIIGILASVAIPAFLRFIRKSKTSEAPINIKAIVNGAVTWYSTERSNATTGDPMRRHFPTEGPGTSVLVGPKTQSNPAVKPCDSGNLAQYVKNSTRWNTQPWKRLKFAISKAHYYQYEYTYNNPTARASQTFTIQAIGDLDCDTTYSTYKASGQISAVTGEVLRGQLVVTNALE